MYAYIEAYPGNKYVAMIEQDSDYTAVGVFADPADPSQAMRIVGDAIRLKLGDRSNPIKQIRARNEIGTIYVWPESNRCVEITADEYHAIMCANQAANDTCADSDRKELIALIRDMLEIADAQDSIPAPAKAAEMRKSDNRPVIDTKKYIRLKKRLAELEAR